MTFFVLYLLVFLGGVGYFIDTGYKRRRLLTQSWGEVLGKLDPIDLEGIRLIAENFQSLDRDQVRFDAKEMWEVVGGLPGLKRLKRNAWAMLNLAVYAEKWNREQAHLVSEMIRQDATRLNRAIVRIQLGFFLQFGFMKSTFYLQQAVSSYALVRSQFVGLYYTAHLGPIPGLES
ncbi:hypothetical protein [Granulicella arctica]|uniref:hypothetical protein n=1 Tax=Granulicella arctica TaxID=940613 RepID=UPI0021E09497|nr:hypothetical protein [Granulicella arctica]